MGAMLGSAESAPNRCHRSGARKEAGLNFLSLGCLAMKNQCISSSRRVERFSFVVLLFLALGTCLLLAAIPAKAEDVTFAEYESNPVYDPTSSSDKAYYPSVLY